MDDHSRVSSGKSPEFSSGQPLQPPPEAMPTSPQIRTEPKPRAQAVQDLKTAATRYKDAQLNSFARLLAKTGVFFQKSLRAENMAKDELKKELSEFLRAIQPNVNLDILISPEKSVEEIYQTATLSEVVAGTEILESSLKLLPGQYDFVLPSELYESTQALLSKAQGHETRAGEFFGARDVKAARKELEKASKALKQAQAKFDKMEKVQKEKQERAELTKQYEGLIKRFNKYRNVKSPFLTKAKNFLINASNQITYNGSLDDIKLALSLARQNLLLYEQDVVAKASASSKRQRERPI